MTITKGAPHPSGAPSGDDSGASSSTGMQPASAQVVRACARGRPIAGTAREVAATQRELKNVVD
ncbi:hypothetical protein [Sorangium sp. So ce341]|uniref:hypothetical protein n=1 Tax=Sorangium sp. So ce341 TaxID=3133302 RepID=UPI003F61BAE5